MRGWLPECGDGEDFESGRWEKCLVGRQGSSACPSGTLSVKGNAPSKGERTEEKIVSGTRETRQRWHFCGVCPTRPLLNAQ